MEYLKLMNWIDRPLAVGLGGILLAAAGRADVTEPAANPYQVILDRNPFGLKPQPAQPLIGPPTNAIQQANVKLTGITSDSIGKKVWLMIPGQPGKNPQYFSIPEHEKQGDIEVLEINDKDNTVKILNAGTQVELNFKDNGMPTPTAPPVSGVPLLPPGTPGALPTPGLIPAPGALPTPIKTAGAIPTPTGTAAADAMANRYGLQPATTTASPGFRTIPARNVRTPSVSPQSQPEGIQSDPVVQRIMLEAQKAQAERQGKPFPPLPPIPGQ